MAISTSLPITLSDVKTELGLLGSESLLDCYAEACSAGFNLTYGSISSNDLQAFRGYNDASCSFTPTMNVSPSFLSSYSSSGGSDTVSITSNTTWSVLSKPSWITVTGASGSGNDSVVTLTASSNGTGSTRSGSVTFRTTTTPYASDSVSVSQQSGFE